MLAAAAVLERHGHPPTVLDLMSEDGLDHVLFLFRADGRWGTIGKSRDAVLHGRRPVFRTVRDLVYSYVDPYVDGSGRIVGYGTFHLDDLTRADWRLGEGNVPSVERGLFRQRHRRLRTSDLRHARVLERSRAFRARHPKAPRDGLRGAGEVVVAERVRRPVGDRSFLEAPAGGSIFIRL